MPNLYLHNLPLFVWGILVTAFLLLLSLPILAGNFLVPALNSAIFWNKLYLIIYITQSEGNLYCLYFKEILRDPMLKFLYYLLSLISLNNLRYINNFNINSLKKYNSNFTTYLTGLIEANGTLIIPQTERSKKGILNYPSIEICFNSKDLPLALIIKKELGYGNVYKIKDVNAYNLIINNFEGILLLVILLNGLMRTPKIISLWKLIDWLNNKFEINIIKKDLDLSPINSNSWLAGFIDGKGDFNIRTTILNKSQWLKRIECKFELTQNQFDYNNQSQFDILKLIADFLLTLVKPTKLKLAKPHFRIRTTSLNGNLKLVEYLNNYPLFSSKYLNYKDWLIALTLFKNKEHLTIDGQNKIINIKCKINDSRTEFNWDHLDSFYSLQK